MDTHNPDPTLTKIRVHGPTFKEYCDLNAVNWSTLKHLRKSPLHYAYALKHPSPDTTARKVARAVHTAVLEPDRFDSDWHVFEGKRRQGKEWDAFEATYPEGNILKADERDEALDIAAAVRANPIAMGYLREGEPEHTIQWTDAETSIGCKGRLDWLAPKAIVDLKVIDNVSVSAAAVLIWQNSWHCQLAFYRAGIKATTHVSLPVVIIGVEKHPPHDVGVFMLDDFAAAMGQEECAGLLRKLADCRAKQSWPGRYDTAQELALPQWVVKADSLPVPDITLEGESL